MDALGKLVVSSDSKEQWHLLNMPKPFNRSSSEVPVGIFWDLQNCPVPHGVSPEVVVENIIMALRVKAQITGPIIEFCAYGNFNHFTSRVDKSLYRCNVNLIHVPKGTNVASKAIVMDIFSFAKDNPPPSAIMLISGDVDCASTLQFAYQRTHTTLLVIPSGVIVSDALKMAALSIWEWPKVAHGEVSVPPSQTLVPPNVNPTNFARRLIINDDLFVQNEEANVLDVSGGLASLVDQSKCQSCTGNLNDLKDELISLLQHFGGPMAVTEVPEEYQKRYNKSLPLSGDVAVSLVKLYKKMGDTVTIGQEGDLEVVNLKDREAAPVHNDKKAERGKGICERMDLATGGCSSDVYPMKKE